MDDSLQLGRSFVLSLVRWTLAVRLLSCLIALFLPLEALEGPQGVVAVAVVGGWTLLLMAPGGQALRWLVRHPLLAMVDVLLAVAVTALVGVGSPLTFVTLSTALLIGLLLPPAAAGLVGAVLVPGHLLVAMAAASGRDSLAFAYVLVVPATYVVLGLLGGLTRHLHQRLALEQARLAQARAETAAAAERGRIAREMHDSVAKSLHGLSLAAAALPRWIERDGHTAAAHAQAIQQAAEQASREARQLLVALRRDQSDLPLPERLTRLRDEFTAQTGLRVELTQPDGLQLDARTTHEVVQVVGEALENAYRHARATLAWVEVDRTGELLTVTVHDDGRGFDPAVLPAHRYGVIGMRERAVHVGGRLEIESAPNEGTSVRMLLPAPWPAPEPERAPEPEPEPVPVPGPVSADEESDR